MPIRTVAASGSPSASPNATATASFTGSLPPWLLPHPRRVIRFIRARLSNSHIHACCLDAPLIAGTACPYPLVWTMNPHILHLAPQAAIPSRPSLAAIVPFLALTDNSSIHRERSHRLWQWAQWYAEQLLITKTDRCLTS